MKHYEESKSAPETITGFLSVYEHSKPMKFVPIGDGDKQGYFVPQGVEMERHMKNMIVNKASLFIAKRMRPGTSWGKGISYLEVGTGVGTGTPQAPQVEIATQEQLRVPLTRKEITSWTYLDASGNPTVTETKTLQFTTVFESEEAIGSIVEMGLFGGDATSTVGTGYMFNYKVFPVWNKQSGMQLTVVWKIQL